MRIEHLSQPNAAFYLLVKGYRTHLSQLNRSQAPNHEQIDQETQGFFRPNKTVLVCYDNRVTLGFVVIKEDEGCFWLEALYVLEARRHQGVASKLFGAGLSYIETHGAKQFYIFVHPDNDAMLAFLQTKGYDRINLLEITQSEKTPKRVMEIIGRKYTY